MGNSSSSNKPPKHSAQEVGEWEIIEPIKKRGEWRPSEAEAKVFKAQINELFNESFLGKHLIENAQRI
jgi:hypothetical protein